MKKFKKGAASFYIVAFSTLILLIIAASFAAVIISEVTRTSNDDLSQSAYDSAMAGVEDAKLAFYNYRNCKAGGGNDCKNILEIMEEADCSMVGKMLGRIDEDGAVSITESSAKNNMSQAYTCVKINTSLEDYRGTLSQGSQIKVVKVKFSDYEIDGKETKVTADMINSVRISWYSGDNAVASGFEYSNIDNNGVIFNGLSENKAAAPPTISLALIQTGPTFNFDDFAETRGEQTNRGMIYLVPTNNTTWASRTVGDNSIGTNGNKIPKSAFLKSNSKTASNLPYAVSCGNNTDADFACSAMVDLPKPIGGTRGDETFYFVVGLPYGKPTADFALEFFCNGICSTVETETITDENGNTITETEGSTQAKLEGVQIEVDSTGRANDLYRRVQARLENPDNFSLSVMGPLELLGDDDTEGDGLLNKTKPVLCEWNFPNRGC